MRVKPYYAPGPTNLHEGLKGKGNLAQPFPNDYKENKGRLVTMKTARYSTFDLIITAMLIALVFVATITLNIRLPIAANGGLVHLGTAMLFIASILFGPKKEHLLALSVWGYLT